MELSINQYMAAKRESYSMMRISYPIAEQDVDEQVYVPLDEQRYYEDTERLIEDYMSELRTFAEQVPEGGEAVIEFEQDYGYDDDRITVRKIGYWRDPTPAERAEREKHNREAREHNAKLRAETEARAAAAERAEFERLKAKFGA